MTARARGHVFIGASLDGFIARQDGSIDWLEAAQRQFPSGDDGGYAEFFTRVDALVVGRTTFDTVRGFPAWPWGDKPVVVMSRRGDVSVPAAQRTCVQVSAETPRALMVRLGGLGLRDVCVDGGQVIRSFLRDGLIDEITLTTLPILLGRGRPLWGDSPRDVALELQATKRWDFGAVQSRYRVATTAPA